MLIRVESDWHLVDKGDEPTWQHWRIEKNILSINGENLDYKYEKISPNEPSSFNWILLISIVVPVVIAMSLLIVIIGKKSKKI